MGIMKKSILFVLLMTGLPAMSQTSHNDSVAYLYEQSLDSLVRVKNAVVDNLDQRAEATTLNPYFYRLMAPGTYYNRPLQQEMSIDWDLNGKPSSVLVEVNEDVLDATAASDHALANLYVTNPSLVHRTEEAIRQSAGFREEAKVTPVSVAPKLSEKAVTVDLGSDAPDTIAVVAKKPNFWKVMGNTSLQFTQSYFSDNWYQGGENNYAGIGMVTVEANYDNKQKVQWDNKLEAQLGFQTATNDEHKARVTSNLLRLTSKLGYKAVKNWFYTGQLMTYTQIAPYFDKNPRKDDGSYDVKPWKARFGTPWYLTLSVGMDFKYKSKDGRFDLSVYLSPVAYYMTYVDRRGAIIGTNLDADYYKNMYGIRKDADGIYTTHSFHKFGPNFTVNSKIRVMKNVMWTSRFYWFSNFHSTLIEWENTLDFTINKYISAKFYAYPRFDDSSIKYKNAKKHRGDYLMFKEWLSLGLSYKF